MSARRLSTIACRVSAKQRLLDFAQILRNTTDALGANNRNVMKTMHEVIDWQVICDLAQQVGSRLNARQWTMTTAESCTGGLIAGAITDIAGSSAWFESGVVSYSNEAKHRLLDVSVKVFEQHGAVSEACVLAMAEGALRSSGADVAVSVSGIAGPGGASPGKPVGTVWLAWALRVTSELPGAQAKTTAQVCVQTDVNVDAQVFLFDGDRVQVREQAVFQALRGTISRIDNIGSRNL